MKRVNMSSGDSNRYDKTRVKRILCGAIATALASTATTVHAIVQDYNRARGADGYTVTNGTGNNLTGSFDGQEAQPNPSTPGISGEFWFAGTNGLVDTDVRAPLGQGVTNTPNDHGGYMYEDFKVGAYWFGGLGNNATVFPGIVLVGGDVPPQVPNLSQVLAYADVLAPVGKPYRYYINSTYDGADHQYSFNGVGTGAWQTVGGTIAQATPVNGGVVYSNHPYDTPNSLAMTVQFANEVAAWDSGPDPAAVIRIDNLTFTPATVTWGGTAGGNWSADSNWRPLLTGGIPIAPSGRNATAIFGSSAAPQTVSLDAPILLPYGGEGQPGGDYPTNNNFYVGTLVFDSAQAYTLAGPEPIHIDTTAANGTNLAGPSGLIQVLSGSHTISAPVILARSTTFDVAGANTLTVSGPLSVFASNGQPVSVGKIGAGTTVVNNLRLTGSLDVSGGTLKIAPNSTASGVSFIPGTITSSARFDITDNKVVTKTAAGTWNGSAYTDITGLVASGRNGNVTPLWDGNGIVTSQTNATTGNYHSIGVARASDVRPNTATETALWAGQTITGTDTLVMYTYGGDATLDGKINIDDYVKIDSGIAASLTGWSNGDFNYDGKVSIDDYITVIDANIGNQNGIFFTGGGVSGGPASAGLVTAVPEPAAAFSLGALGALSLLRRRRHFSPLPPGEGRVRANALCSRHLIFARIPAFSPREKAHEATM
jgi:hypothetical protein